MFWDSDFSMEEHEIEAEVADNERGSITRRSQGRARGRGEKRGEQRDGRQGRGRGNTREHRRAVEEGI